MENLLSQETDSGVFPASTNKLFFVSFYRYLSARKIYEELFFIENIIRGKNSRWSL